MKTEMEVLDGVLVIETDDGTHKAVVDVPTGEVIHLEYTVTTVHKLTQFMTKVKTRYNKFLTSKAIDDFI
jgi:hypothetical protein